MPTRRDWADDEAEAVLDQLHEDDPDQADGQLLLDRYAIALRAAEKRGRVAGLREAADHLETNRNCDIPNCEVCINRRYSATEIRDAADKLESEAP